MKALAICFVVPFTILSAHDFNGRGTQAIALANAFASIADNAWAISYNPAGLSRLTRFESSAFLIPQQFGVPDLKTTSVAAACAFPFGTVGFIVERFGFDLYHTTDVDLGYGVRVDSALSIGATLNTEWVTIERYGTARSMTLDVGLLGDPSPGISIGVSVRNVFAATLGENRERLPQVLALGLCFRPFDGFRAVTEVEKDVRFATILKAGIEKEFLGFLRLRCGISNNPDKFAAGMAVRCSFAEFGYAGYSHPDLGWTHHIEVGLQWGE